MRQSPSVRWLAVVAAFALTAGSCGDNHGGKRAAGKGAHDSGGTTYAESTAGLEHLFRDLFAAIGDHDRARVKTLTAGLELPRARRWFRRTFGDTLGDQLADEYGPTAGNFDQLAHVLEALVARHQTDLEVEVFTSASDPNATGYQSLALAAMVQPSPLYSVRLSTIGKDDGFHIWSFVYDRGHFRWVGKMRAVYRGEPSDPDLLELRVRIARAATPGDHE